MRSNMAFFGILFSAHNHLHRESPRLRALWWRHRRLLWIGCDKFLAAINSSSHESARIWQLHASECRSRKSKSDLRFLLFSDHRGVLLSCCCRLKAKVIISRLDKAKAFASVHSFGCKLYEGYLRELSVYLRLQTKSHSSQQCCLCCNSDSQQYFLKANFNCCPFSTIEIRCCPLQDCVLNLFAWGLKYFYIDFFAYDKTCLVPKALDSRPIR